MSDLPEVSFKQLVGIATALRGKIPKSLMIPLERAAKIRGKWDLETDEFWGTAKREHAKLINWISNRALARLSGSRGAAVRESDWEEESLRILQQMDGEWEGGSTAHGR